MTGWTGSTLHMFEGAVSMFGGTDEAESEASSPNSALSPSISKEPMIPIGSGPYA